MKTTFALGLIASLALNGVLVWFVLTNRSAAPAGSATPATVRTAVEAPKTDAAPGIDPDAWPNLETKDMPELVARLRTAGFPIETIRAILSVQLSENFTARWRALDPDAANRPFWKNRMPNPQADLAMRQSSRDYQKQMRELLGQDAEAENPLAMLNQGRRVDFLPSDKADEVKGIIRNFEEQRQDLYATGAMTIDREKMADLEKAQRAAIARVLTPQEMEEYDLRNSQTANSLRDDLAVFNPTEEEFRMMFRLKQPFDEQYDTRYQTGPMSQDVMRQRMEAQRLVTEQIKAALPPERAAEYTRAIDYNYRRTSQLVARLELPPETTGQVYALQQEFQQRVQLINAGRPTAQARNEQLAVLAADAKAKVGSVLGANGLEAYKQYGGSWMQQLEPREVRPLPRPAVPTPKN